MNKKSINKIKTFFYMHNNQPRREKELNDFLAQDNIEVIQILQSSATGSIFEDKPQYLDVGVVITIVYNEK